MSLKTYTIVAIALATLFQASCTNQNNSASSSSGSNLPAILTANAAETSNSFVQPLAPSPSKCRPSTSLPNMGRDKHSMPYYHANQRTRLVRTTAYTHSEGDHKAYGMKNAVGTQLKYTSSVRSAAADWSIYPLGTKFRIKGQPYLYVVDDYGSALVGTNTIDIYHPSKMLMGSWGRRYVEITVVQWGSPELSRQLLEGRKGSKHCRQMLMAINKGAQEGFYAKTN